MNKETVIVTGGAGFIGSHIADAFLERDWDVHILDDMSGGRMENVPEGATFHQLDIRSSEARELVLKVAPQALVHQAAQMDVRRSVADPSFDADVNIRGTLNLLEACREASVDQVLFASTGGAIYGEQDSFPADESHPQRPVSPYGVSKLSVERYLFFYHVSYGLNVTCLRYANVYGERQNPHGEAGVVAIFLQRLLAGEDCRINGDGLQTRDYVHVSDVVKANIAAVGLEGFHTFNVGTGKETNVIELYESLAEAVGVDKKAAHGPGMPGEQRRSVISPKLIQDQLGVPAPLPLDRGFKRTAEWFENRCDS